MRSKLTNHQLAIWLESKLHEDAPIFNIGTYALVDGTLDYEILSEAIKNVITQNDALSICIKNDLVDPEQYFINQPFNLEYKKFENNLSEKSYVKSWMDKEFTKPINIHDNQLFRFYLVHFSDKSYIFLKFHHIIIDGWSRALLIKKIAEQYSFLLKNTKVQNESSYFNYVNTLHNQSHYNLDDAKQYWKDEFSDFHYQPMFKKINQDLDHASSSRKRMIIEKNVFDIFLGNDFSEKKSNFYFYLAAFYLTVSRSLGKSEVVIGIPLLNRFDESQLNTIGYFVGLIPLRLSFDTDISFLDLMIGIKKKLNDSVSYRSLSINQINKVCGVNFTNSTQLYDVVFSFEPHNHDCQFGSLNVVESGTFSSDYEQNPLVVHLEQFNSNNDINFEWDYNNNFFTEDDIDLLIERYQRVIKNFRDNTNLSILEAPIISKFELENIKKFETGKNVLNHPFSLCERIYIQSKKHPNKVIVEDDCFKITYKQLIKKAETVASYLSSIGVTKDQKVAIFTERNIDTISSILGVMFSSASYVPIDPKTTPNRVRFMLSEVKAKIVIGHVDDYNDYDDFTYINYNSIISKKPFKLNKQNIDDLVYAMFTSGTTGNPKAIEISHKNIINLIDGLSEEIYDKYDLNDKMGLISSFNFDASIQHLFVSLCTARTLVIIPEEHRKDGLKLLNYINQKEIVICDGIPSHLSAIISRFDQLPDCSKLKHLVIGGESFTINLANEFFDWIGHRNVKVTNVYGPTECTVDSTFFTFDKESYKKYDKIPIGYPIRNTKVYLLNEHGMRVPTGVKGELCISGEGMSKGYSNQPSLTKDKFRFNKTLNELVYHTGDIAYRNKDGILFYSGRNDNQVKIRGYRIELAEIEHWLDKITNVSRSLVLVAKQSNKPSLVGFIESSNTLDPKSIEMELLRYLPDYMIPSKFILLKQFPLTKTGKVDIHSLRKSIEANNIDVLPSKMSKIEKQVFDVMSKILKTNNIDVNDSFFSLGGDSLDLVYFLAELEKEMNVKLDMNQFAKSNSVKSIAKLIESKNVANCTEINLKKELSKFTISSTKYKRLNSLNHSTAFLTGSTGFVGAFLLKELVSKYNKVICLVRSKNEQIAIEKLKNTLKRYKIIDQINLESVEIWVGDLEKENLGLNTSFVDKFIHRVNVIYHCAAIVNFILDYDSVKQANINSTRILLEWCKMGVKKQFNFISTKGVFSSKQKRSYSEFESSSNQLHYKERGYESSKWVAEGLIESVRNEISCNIFRLGRITGDSSHGNARFDDFFHRFISGCILLNAFPKELLNKSTDLTPVDVSSAVIVNLSKDNSRNFHINNKFEAHYHDFLSECSKNGIDLAIVEYSTWLEKLNSFNEANPDNPLFLITPLLRDHNWFNSDDFRLLSNETTEYMSLKGLNWPKGKELWEVYTKRFIEFTLVNQPKS